MTPLDAVLGFLILTVGLLMGGAIARRHLSFGFLDITLAAIFCLGGLRLLAHAGGWA